VELGDAVLGEVEAKGDVGQAGDRCFLGLDQKGLDLAARECVHLGLTLDSYRTGRRSSGMPCWRNQRVDWWEEWEKGLKRDTR